MIFSRGLHHIMQSGDVGVKPTTNILNIKQNDVNACQLFSLGLAVAAIQRDNRQPRLGIHRRLDMSAGLSLATETVLRTENSHHIYTRSEQCINQMGILDHGCVIAANGHFFAF